jgi:ethanolamine permease
MISFLRLRLLFPHIDRPFRSPLGMTGGVIAAAIAAITLFSLFLNPDYRIGMIGAVVWFVLGILYFALHGRKHLVLAPEEAFARNARAASTAAPHL